MNSYTLTEKQVVEIVKAGLNSNSEVRLAAIDYNWGPPISGRFDSDFTQVWAVVKSAVHPANVMLYGLFGNTWMDAPGPFEKRQVIGEWELYYFAGGTPPAQFVIRLETEDGQTYYDNNGGFGNNYRIVPYDGRGTSNLVVGDVIYGFIGFVNYRLTGAPK